MDLSDPTWWAYVGLLILAVYFRFSRVFSVRNFDLLLLIGLSTSLTATLEIRQPPPGQAATIRSSRLTSLPAQPPPASTVLLVSLLQPNPDELNPQTPTRQPPRTPAISTPDLQPPPGTSDTPQSRSPMHRWASLSLVGFTLLLIVRLILDESLTRRPRLDQNLNS
jgi:hypothetical protein